MGEGGIVNYRMEKSVDHDGHVSMESVREDGEVVEEGRGSTLSHPPSTPSQTVFMASVKHHEIRAAL